MATTLLLGVAAVNTGNNLLFLVVSALLGFMAVSGVLGWLNIRGLEVIVRVPDEVYAGLDTLISLRVRNKKRMLPSFLVQVGVCGGETYFTLLDPGASEGGAVLTSFAKRGIESVSQAVVSSNFPVNFFIRYTRVPVSCSFAVFPAPRAAAPSLTGENKDTGAAHPSPRKGYEGDLAKITDYRGGEALKLIHWRLSAKHEVFKVKEMTATADEPVLLEVELLPGRDLEERLSLCSHLINRLIKGGHAVGLKLGERVIPPDYTKPHRLKLLGELAVYGKD